MKAYEALKKIYEDAYPFRQIDAILEWDTRTMMPPDAIEKRLALQQALYHVIRSQREHEQIDRLVEEAKTERDKLFGWDQRNLDLIIHIRRIQNVLPPALVVKLDHLQPHCKLLWPQAKREKSWAVIAPTFIEMVHATRERAQLIAGLLNCSPYEALLYSYTRGVSTLRIDSLFAQIKPIMAEILAKPSGPHPRLPVTLTRDQQFHLTRNMVEKIGFNFKRGRMDISDKAFHKGMDLDTRIAINIIPDNFLGTVYSGLHETGHALHYQHHPEDWAAQPVGTSGDFCLREAMAFIWQYYICREPQFVDILAAETSAVAGQVVTSGDLWPVLAQSRASVLRNGHGDANFMTHILIRYEMERDLINGVIEPEDVPAIWNQKVKDYLGLDVPDDGQGCLQDIHWYKGSFGYFPCYALAHFYAAQLFHKAKTTISDFSDRFLDDNAMAMIEFLAWNVYSKANSATGLQILEEAVGGKLDPSYFINGLKQQR